MARLQRPRARAGRGRQPATARACQVPRDLREQPRRVLHGPRGRPEAPRRGGPQRAQRGRPHPARAAGAHRAPDTGAGRRAREVFLDEICPELDKEGIRINRWSALDATASGRSLSTYFTETVFPVLTPLAVDPAHPFPYISGLSLNLAVTVRDPRGPHRAVRAGQGAQQRPAARPGGARGPGRRVDHLPADRGPDRRAPVGAVHRHGGDGGPRVPGHAQRRPRGGGRPRRRPAAGAGARAGPAPVRAAGAARGRRHDEPSTCWSCCCASWTSTRTTSSPCPGLLDLTALWQIDGVDRPDLKDEPFRPATARRLRRGRDRQERLRHAARGRRPRPPPVRLVLHQRAALHRAGRGRPRTCLAIKQTLYRTSGDSPIVDALKDAAAAGKQVVALVEIKARFDEQANIRWARELERAGVHVVYGLVGLKTHCKTCLVVRQEGSHDPALLPHRHRQLQPEDRAAVRRPRGAHRRPDDRRRPHRPVQLAHRLLAPDRVPEPARGARTACGAGIVRRIEDEIEAHREGKDARVRIKVNSLVDEQVIDALYRASQAGVPVDVVVRGICAIRPGREGLQREHPGPLDPRPFPRALADLPLRRGGRVLDRQRGHDAPQPGPARRGAAAGDRHEARHVPARRWSTPASTRRRGAGRSPPTARGGPPRRRTPACRRCATTRPR